MIVINLIAENLPFPRTQNAKKWNIFNAVCCHHRGHSRDTRKRGNLLINPDESIVYNCYNCGFKASFKNYSLTKNFELLMSYLNISHEDIQRAKLELISKKINGDISSNDISSNLLPDLNFPTVSLPGNPKLVSDLVSSGYHLKSKAFNQCLQYLVSRGRAVAEGSDYYWSSEPLIENETVKLPLYNRLIIPFKYQNRIVGWTARYTYGRTPKNVPKYYNSNLPTGFLYNGDFISSLSRKYIIIVEGPLDAIAISGVSPFGSTMSKAQVNWLNSTDKEKIVLPDRERTNQDLIDTALKNKWSVSFPSWGDKIKDAADASAVYGRLYTIHSIIQSRTSNENKIQINRNML